MKEGNANTQYVVIVAKIDLEKLESDFSAEAQGAVDFEFDDENDTDEGVCWFDESYASAELDEKLQELYGKGLVDSGAQIVTTGEQLLAWAPKYKDTTRFIKRALGLRG